MLAMSTSGFEFANIALAILLVNVVSAYVAYCFRNCSVFIAGILGSLLGFIVPRMEVSANGTAESLFMGRVGRSFEHAFWCGLLGASVCISVVLFVSVIRNKVQQ